MEMTPAQKQTQSREKRDAKKNRKFINWTINKLKNDHEFYLETTGRIGREAGRYYREGRTKEEVLDALRKKLNEGAKEHKRICTDFIKIEEELNQERLDLLGWEMMKLWQSEGEYENE